MIVVSIRNDTRPDDGGALHVYLVPTAVSEEPATARHRVTGDPLKPGQSIGVSIGAHMHAVVVAAGP